MLPFYGKLHIAYLEDVAVTPSNSEGPPPPALEASELEAVVAMYSQRLQVQERITHQVADAVTYLLSRRAAASGPAAQGDVLVLVDAAHMCMVARGVESHAGSTTSLAVRGELLHSTPELRRTILREARHAAMRC